MKDDPRTAEFRPPERLGELLGELNELLAGCQAAVNRRYAKPRYPLLLIMGAPHSGTTLFLQWLAESRLWGYPTNVISRFFAAPYIGARVQQVLIENDYREQVSDFKHTQPYASTLGYTEGALAPNEFWYFWRRFFPFSPEADVVPPEALARVDVTRLNTELAALEAALQKPLAMKGMLLNWHIPFLNAAFEKVLFVNLRREPAYVVQSVLAARRKYFGTEEPWYSFKPPEYRWLKEKSPVAQVAGQVYFIRQATDEGCAQVAERRKLVLDYETFCENPAATWETLRGKMAEQGYLLPGDYAGPRHFDAANQVRTSPQRWFQIQQALVEMQRR
jgi:hypothetical protein